METKQCARCATWYPSTAVLDGYCPDCTKALRINEQRQGIWYMRRDSRDASLYHVWKDCTCSVGPHADPFAGPLLRNLSVTDIVDLRRMFDAALAGSGARPAEEQ